MLDIDWLSLSVVSTIAGVHIAINAGYLTVMLRIGMTEVSTDTTDLTNKQKSTSCGRRHLGLRLVIIFVIIKIIIVVMGESRL